MLISLKAVIQLIKTEFRKTKWNSSNLLKPFLFHENVDFKWLGCNCTQSHHLGWFLALLPFYPSPACQLFFPLSGSDFGCEIHWQTLTGRLGQHGGDQCVRQWPLLLIIAMCNLLNVLSILARSSFEVHLLVCHVAFESINLYLLFLVQILTVCRYI